MQVRLIQPNLFVTGRYEEPISKILHRQCIKFYFQKYPNRSRSSLLIAFELC